MHNLNTADEQQNGLQPQEVAMLCNGDEVYGIGTIIKLYAKGAPGMRFVCFSDGHLYQSLKDMNADVILGDGLNDFVPRKSATTLISMPGLMRKTRADAQRLHQTLKPLGIRVLHTHRLAQQIISGHMRPLGYRTAWQINNNMNRQRLWGIGQKLNWKLVR